MDMRKDHGTILIIEQEQNKDLSNEKTLAIP